MKILVTGGAGFIGSNLVHHLLGRTRHRVVNFDKLTYAGNLESLAGLEQDDRYTFVQGDIADAEAVSAVFREHQPEAVMHLAAESHVDRSIDGPAAFIETNVTGTFTLLQSALAHWREQGRPEAFRFLHVSTDEVYGSLGEEDPAFSETTRYDPHSPYSASKAASDHLARAWHDTYGLPVLVTNCSNNYGPYQFPEKLLPVVILKCLRGEPIPVYGKGENIRDWLYVEDHCAALTTVLEHGTPGETYNIGGNNERKNIELVREICDLVDEETAEEGHAAGSEQPETGAGAQSAISNPPSEIRNPQSAIRNQQSAIRNPPSSALITFVTDRPGHDLRYAIDASKIRRDLGWEPQEDRISGLRKTVRWYLDHRAWWERILSGDYRLERLGKDVEGFKG